MKKTLLICLISLYAFTPVLAFSGYKTADTVALITTAAKDSEISPSNSVVNVIDKSVIVSATANATKAAIYADSSASVAKSSAAKNPSSTAFNSGTHLVDSTIFRNPKTNSPIINPQSPNHQLLTTNDYPTNDQSLITNDQLTNSQSPNDQFLIQGTFKEA
jgi:hypothetical protein